MGSPEGILPQHAPSRLPVACAEPSLEGKEQAFSYWRPPFPSTSLPQSSSPPHLRIRTLEAERAWSAGLLNDWLRTDTLPTGS